MSLHNDPRYIALAAEAALVLGSKDRDIIAAILAQWTCEKGNDDAYPPARNNPGNLARGAASGLGFSFTIQYPNPQPGNPIVTFWSAAGGAGAYARLIASGTRYAGVRKAVKAGDGEAFIRAMGKSGYGTGTACMLSAYHPPAPDTDTPPPNTGDPDMAQVPITDTTPHMVDVKAPMTFYHLDASVQSTGHGAVTNVYSPYVAKNGTSTFYAIYARREDGTAQVILTKPSAVRPGP